MTPADRRPGSQAELSALVELAYQHWDAGRLAEAAATFGRILAVRPDLPEAHYALGKVLVGQGKPKEAASELRKALRLRPQYAEAHNALGLVLRSLQKLDEAAAHLERAVAMRPNYAEAWNNLGAVHTAQGRLDQAAQRFVQAIALSPRYAEAYNNLGAIHAAQGQLEQAAVQLEQAVALNPDYADAHNALGHVRWRQSELEKAAAHFERVIALRPGQAQAYSNLASVLRTMNRLDEAIAEFQRSLALAPGGAEAECTLATCYLLKGDFQRGWPALEARLRLPGARQLPDLPRWQGQDLSNRRLLLVAEQGMGDTLQMLRFARWLKARGAEIVLAVQPALHRLLAAHRDVDELFVLGSTGAWPPADFYLPLLSAPGALGIDAGSIPGETPYLWADPELTERWRQELAQIDGFKIGIAWQGSPAYSADRWRSIPLAHFAPLARQPGVRLISLQKGAGSEQIRAVDFPVVDFSERLDEAAGPFRDTAAVVRNLDLVVACDSALAHLAGAMAAPVFLALSWAGDWRWLLDRQDSPWYPSVRLFRQTALGDWQNVFKRITAAVAARQEARKP